MNPRKYKDEKPEAGISRRQFLKYSGITGSALLLGMKGGVMMANSQMIGLCESCGQDYCQECTDAREWERYCSRACENFAKKCESDDAVWIEGLSK